MALTIIPLNYFGTELQFTAAGGIWGGLDPTTSCRFARKFFRWGVDGSWWLGSSGEVDGHAAAVLPWLWEFRGRMLVEGMPSNLG